MLDLLLQGRFDEYADAMRQGAKTWLFIHVPKTAGSSLSNELAAGLRPYYNIHINHADTSRPGPERFDAAVDAFLAEAKTTYFRSVSGHILQRHVEAILTSLPGIRALTLLREPLSRLISDYHYQLSPMHPLHREVAARTPNFMAFVELPGPQNRMARHLVPPGMIRGNRIDEAIDYVTHNLAFVGLQERYDLYFRLLTLIVFGRSQSPTEKKRVNDNKERLEITAEQVARVRQLNSLDFAIYETMASRLGQVEPGLQSWLGITCDAKLPESLSSDDCTRTGGESGV